MSKLGIAPNLADAYAARGAAYAEKDDLDRAIADYTELIRLKPYAVHTVGPVVSAIGQKAGVVVGQTEKMVNEDGRKVKKSVKMFAGSHDLRRAFCSRWSRKVMPAVLQRLARHSHISTTMAYYVSLSADEIGADLWASHAATIGNTLGNTAQETTQGAGVECHT